MNAEQLYSYVCEKLRKACTNEELHEMRKQLTEVKRTGIGQAYEISQLKLRVEDRLLNQGGF